MLLTHEGLSILELENTTHSPAAQAQPSAPKAAVLSVLHASLQIVLSSHFQPAFSPLLPALQVFVQFPGVSFAKDK